MSGHSKWHNIKIRKNKVDAQRGKIFTSVAKEIIIAAREGGGDPASNFRLRVAVEKAKSVNMPSDNIKRSIQKGTGELKGEAELEEILYEGYGPAGIAVLIIAVTNNRNRTVAEVRNILSKHGGSLGASGCVLWMFEKKGIIIFNKDKIDEETAFMIATDAGADDMNADGDTLEITCSPQDFQAVKEAFEAKGFAPDENKITMIAKNTVQVKEDQAGKMLKLLDVLEENEDIQEVYSNADISDEIMEKFA